MYDSYNGNIIVGPEGRPSPVPCVAKCDKCDRLRAGLSMSWNESKYFYCCGI